MHDNYDQCLVLSPWWSVWWYLSDPTLGCY